MVKLSERIKKEKSRKIVGCPHVIIEARAGTGKTTTLIEGLKVLRGIEPSITPSPQQSDIWEQMKLSSDAKTVCFVAFNKSIADTLKQRVPQGCDAMTMHSMGFKTVRKIYPNIRMEEYRVDNIICRLLNKDSRELRRAKPELLTLTKQLVSLCKMNLVDGQLEELAELASYYDIDMNGSQSEVFDLVPRVLEECKRVDQDLQLDFNDMIWLPVVLNLPTFQYDLLLVDESQDLNRCQQELAKRSGKRLIFCGDPKQAIYGFAGADAQSMFRLEEELKQTEAGCIHLPLTVTRRCGKAIVAEANKIVPDFAAHESNSEGKINHMGLKSGSGPNGVPFPSYNQSVQPNDMILCRCNAPLVSECFKFLRNNQKANIQGRDIGQGLISTIKKLPCMKGIDPNNCSQVSIPNVLSDLGDWYDKEVAKEAAKKNPSENRMIGLRDRHDCLVEFCSEGNSAQDIIIRIERIFSDKNQGGILLSSVHKAKGLEAKRVFILQLENASMPHPMAKTAWEREQEMNIKYVAITRAINELVWVTN